MRRALFLSLIALALCACQSGDDSSAPAAARVISATAAIATSATPPPMAVALAPQINDADFLQFDKTLSSDAFGGRKPGTRGEVLTIRYLVDQFRRMHLTPGNHGYWLQSVPVVTTTLLNTGTRLEVRTGGDPQLFDGKAMTWYGRWVYKYEEAARMGAAACFIVHTSDDAAGYSWTVVRNSNGGPVQSLPASVAPGPRLAVAGWLTLAAAQRLFHSAGLDFDSLAAQAAQRGFKPVALRATASVLLRSAITHGRSYNLLA